MPVLKKLMEAQYGPWFSEPVDPIKLNIPDYPTIVKRPMDLGTIKRRLDSGSHYRTFHDFQVDVDLVWYNARLYNPQDHQVHQIAVQYQRNFREMFKKVEDEFQTEVKRKYDDGNTCRLCGGTRLKFDAAILHCNGPCGQKIRRNSRYYASPDNKFHWCANCYERLEDTIITVESELRKSDLIQKKNNEQAEESWVQCDHCRGWFHQICALFNGKRNENNPSKKKAFHCALCILKRLGKNNTGPAFPGARRLVAKSALPPLCCVGWLVVGWCSAACADPPCPLVCRAWYRPAGQRAVQVLGEAFARHAGSAAAAACGGFEDSVGQGATRNGRVRAGGVPSAQDALCEAQDDGEVPRQGPRVVPS